MPLPKISTPIFTVKVPSSGKSITMRPFLVKEEKILLVAKESGAEVDIIKAVKAVVNNCIVEGIDIDELTTFDVEYLFIQLRAQSVNNVIEVIYTDSEDKNEYPVSIDLNDVTVINLDRSLSKIIVDDKLTLYLKYAPAKMLDEAQQLFQDVEAEGFAEKVDKWILTSTLEKIVDGDEVHSFADYSQEEIIAYVNTMPRQVYSKIEQFLANTPSVYYKATYKTEDGTEKHVELKSIFDFFTWG
jgi:hypothetical protein